MKGYILYIILFLIGIIGTYSIIPLFKNLLIDSNVVWNNKVDLCPDSCYVDSVLLN